MVGFYTSVPLFVRQLAEDGCRGSKKCFPVLDLGQD